MRRRRLLQSLAAAPLAGALGGCAAARASRGLDALELAPDVWMLPGLPGEPDEATLGRIGNAGFVVGPQGVVVVDSGVSYRHGLAILDAIGRVTDKPVKLLVLTHAKQEFVFGAQAFRERGVPVAMQREAAALMAARCDGCLKTLKRTLGDDAMAGTVLVKPDRLLDGDETLAEIGRPLELLSFGRSSGPGDTAVLDPATGTLFAGGLVDAQRIPDVQDAELAQWRVALAALAKRPLRRVVPGHGPAAGPESIRAVDRYLVLLESTLIKLLDAGAALSEVPDLAALPDYERWDQYAIVHRRNASIVFLRLERALLAK